MSSNNPTSILASFSTMKSLVDAQKYQSPYQILAEFIQYIIIKRNLYSFAAVEMKNQLNRVFGFDIPEAVISTASRNLSFIKKRNGLYHVNQNELKENSDFERMKKVAEENNDNIIDQLISFARVSNPKSMISTDALTQEFIAYLLDDQQTTATGQYTDLIGQFILKFESDQTIQSALTAIREGSILYIGLNHNINETGSLIKPLTLFLGTEVLFSLCGFNGDIYKTLAQDLYSQIKIANSGAKKISLRYFLEVKREIDDFFACAERIIDGKQEYYDTAAMKSIINGCSTSGDVRIKKSDFLYQLQHSYGIMEDDRESYYDSKDDSYNIESLYADPQQYDSLRVVSHINKLRKGRLYPYELDAEFLLVTDSGLILRASREQVERLKKERAVDSACDYAVSVERLTNILWYKLGNGLGGKEYPNNVNAVLKARMLLASKISQNTIKIYEKTKAEYQAGVISKEQLASRIITLRHKPIVPEELTSETIDDSLNFSLEYLTRYEEEVNRTKEALEEKEHLLQELSNQKDRMISKKDDALAEKDQQLQAEQDSKAKLEAELEEYHRMDREKEQKSIKRKKIARLVFSIIWKLTVIALSVVVVAWLFGKVNEVYSNAVSLVVGLFEFILFIRSVLQKDLKRFKSDSNEEGVSEK